MVYARPLGSLSSLLLVTVLSAQEPIDSEEFAAAVAWFDALGHPALADKPFVRVATGLWTQSGNEPKQNTFVMGFLLEDDGRKFTVFTPGLEHRTFERTPKGAAAHDRIGFVVESLLPHCRQLTAAAHRRPDRRESPFDMRGFGTPQPSPSTRRFVLARACHALGETALAQTLAAVRDRGAKAHTLLAGLEEDLAHVGMWRLIVAFDDLERSYADLLAQCEQLLQQFPNSRHLERATVTRDLLARMVQEEREHIAPPADSDELAQLRELVYRLRYQNGKQWSQPGWCDVFSDPRGDDSPAAQLVARGYEALEALAPACDDDSFTRSVRFHRDFYFSHRVLRVKDVATAVVARITGAPCRNSDDALRLWRDYEEKGERRVLLEWAEQGSAEHLARLLRRYPADALTAMHNALALRPDDATRASLLAVIAGAPGDGATEVLRDAMRQREHVRSRTTAARALFLRGRTSEAVDTMIDAWRGDLDEAGTSQVAAFLCTCGRRRAVEALATHPGRLDDDAIRALGSGEARFDAVLLPDGTTHGGYRRLGDPANDVDAAIEDLLGSLLDERRVFQGSFNGTADPEVRDFAAAALHTRFPARYEFDFGAPLQQRRHMILVATNTWRRGHGLEPLPLPERPNIPLADPRLLEPLLTSARLERSATARRRVLDRIEALGLGALPAVCERAEQERDPARKQEWRELASRVASHVRAVQLGDDSAPYPLRLRPLATTLTGSSLDPEAIAALLVAFGSGEADEPDSLQLLVTRAGDGTGVVVEFTFGKGKRAAGDFLRYSYSAHAGRKALTNASGAGIRRLAGERDHYDDFIDALTQALAAPADQPVDARYEMHF